MRNFYQLYFCCLLMIGHGTFVLGQERKDSVYDLQQVNLNNKKPIDLIAPQTLDGDILTRLNSHSVADALRYFSGIQLKDYGGVGGLKTVDVRSMGSQHVGVYYDGIQLGNAQNGVVDLGKYSLDDLVSISLYNGQKSNIFQSAKDYASASSIYLQSKKPQFKNNKKYNLTLRYKTGSIQLINPSARFEYKINDQISTSLSSEYLKSNGEYKFRVIKRNADNSIANDTTAIRKDGQIEARRFELGIYGNHNTLSWNIKGYSYLSDRGIPAAIIRNGFGAKGQTLTDKNYFTQGSVQKKWGKFESRINLKYAHDFTHFVDTVSSIKTQNKYTQQEFYFSSANYFKIRSNWDMNIAFDFQYNKLDATLKNFSYPQRYTQLLAIASTYQLQRLKIQGSLLGSFVREQVEMNTSAPDKSVWTPTLIGSFQPFTTRDFYINAFYKRVFRMPTFNDLYYTNIGYSNLKPEYTNQYNIGLDYTWRNLGKLHYLNAKIDMYYNEVEDKIIAAPNGSMFRWMMMNLGKVQIKGADVKIQGHLNLSDFDFKSTLNYTYQKAQDYTSQSRSYYKDQIPYVPVHSGSFILNSTYKTWGLNYSFLYVGERYDANQNNNKYNYIKPWFTHDFSIQKSFELKKIRFNGSFEVNNIMNKYYDIVLNYPMPGRQFKIIISTYL
ncbi:TonB-dependent receptor [Faecalibacter macacae]|nr:TonB-dependent receptor [Faecalibacter macacae]